MKASLFNQRSTGGFTLVEVIIASMILGLTILAALASVQASTTSTIAGTDVTQAAILAEGLREWTMNLPWNDLDADEALQDQASPGPNASPPSSAVDDLNDLRGVDGTGVTYTPPIADGPSEPLDKLTGWSEHIELSWRDPQNVQTEVDPGASDVLYVSVVFRKDGEHVLTTGWLIARRDDE
jgi:prepilin-type N-terminal cleavage/methylation domain-containing protein